MADKDNKEFTRQLFPSDCLSLSRLSDLTHGLVKGFHITHFYSTHLLVTYFQAQQIKQTGFSLKKPRTTISQNHLLWGCSNKTPCLAPTPSSDREELLQPMATPPNPPRTVICSEEAGISHEVVVGEGERSDMEASSSNPAGYKYFTFNETFLLTLTIKVLIPKRHVSL